MEKIIFNPKGNRILTSIMAALLLGFAWQIRGSGTSDPSVVALLFLLFLSINYSPRKKFNILVFSLITFFIGVTRTGWGTFVSQGGLPGIDIPKVAVLNYLVDGVNQEFPVDWYMGYIWMFIVGISWFGIPSLLFGGYLFTKLKYTFKDFFIILALFILSWYLLGFLVKFIAPYLVPEYYNKVYLTDISGDAKRFFGSVTNNMSRALAIIPVLLYVRFIKSDIRFFKYALSAMLIFASSIAIADIFWPLAHLLGMHGITGWSLWEYFTGFFFGGGLFWFYGRFSDKELAETDISTGMDVSKWKPFWKFVIYSFALYFLFFHGVAESLEGGIRKAFFAAGVVYKPDVPTVKLIVSVIGIFFYWLYSQGKIGKTFAKKSFREKSLIVLIIMLPLCYLNFAMHHIIAGDLFNFHRDNSAVRFDTLSFVIVEIYIVFLFINLKKA